MNRPIMVLDQPTSHLDPESERRVVAFLAKYLATRSTIVVSHRDVFGEIATKRTIVRDRTLHEIARELTFSCGHRDLAVLIKQEG